MTTSFATIADFFVHGLPSTAAVPPPRTIELVDVSNGRILTKGHGLVDGDVVKFEGQGTLPTPLNSTTIYTVTMVDLDLFVVSLTGTPIVLTNVGVKPYEWRVDPRPAYQKSLIAASSTIQDHATAHGEILTPTEQVIKLTCIIAAWDIAYTNRLRLPLTDKFLEGAKARHDDAWITLRSWEKGRRIAGVKDVTPNTAEAAAITGGPAAAPTNWGWGCGL